LKINLGILEVRVLELYKYILTSEFFLGLNIALVFANMARLSFGPCKKKLFWTLQNFLFFKIVSDPIFVMICIRGT